MEWQNDVTDDFFNMAEQLKPQDYICDPSLSLS